MLGFILNIPYSLIGLIIGLISIPLKLKYNSNPIAVVISVKNFWWTFGYMKKARAMAIGHVVLLGPNIEINDLEHELIHVKQHDELPIIYPFFYYYELLRNGYINNKYEVEAYTKAGNVYKGKQTKEVSNRRQRVTAIIIKDNRILLIRRVKPGVEYYTFPGGGVDEGESNGDAITREVKEELCLEVKKMKLLYVLTDVAIHSFTTIHKGNRDEPYYLIEAYEGEPQIGGPERERMNKEDQYHIEWIQINDLTKIKNLYPEVGVQKFLEYYRLYR